MLFLFVLGCVATGEVVGILFPRKKGKEDIVIAMEESLTLEREVNRMILERRDLMFQLCKELEIDDKDFLAAIDKDAGL